MMADSEQPPSANSRTTASRSPAPPLPRSPPRTPALPPPAPPALPPSPLPPPSSRSLALSRSCSLALSLPRSLALSLSRPLALALSLALSLTLSLSLPLSRSDHCRDHCSASWAPRASPASGIDAACHSAATCRPVRPQGGGIAYLLPWRLWRPRGRRWKDGPSGRVRLAVLGHGVSAVRLCISLLLALDHRHRAVGVYDRAAVLQRWYGAVGLGLLPLVG